MKEDQKTKPQAYKILHVHPYLKALNGSERLLVELVRSWPNNSKHNIVTAGQSFYLPQDLDVPVRVSWGAPAPDSPLALLWSYLVLPFTVLHGEADTIIAHSHAAIFPSAIRKIFRGGKLIYLCHEPPRFLYDLRSLTLSRRGPVGRVVLKVGAPILRLIDSWAVTKADASFVLSRYSAKQFEDIYGKKPIIEPPGVDLEQFRPLAKTDFHPGPLITVGKLHPRKNLSLLLAALSLEQLSNIRLIVVGTGPQETELKSLATDIGNNDRIDWLGSVNDQELQSAYNKASVFVFCAHDEPFGLVVLEAMSIGLPVVVPNEGGPQEIVGNGKYGWVYRQDNVNSLSTAIKQATAATKEELTAAQAHAQSYSWKRYTKAIAKKAML